MTINIDFYRQEAQATYDSPQYFWWKMVDRYITVKEHRENIYNYMEWKSAGAGGLINIDDTFLSKSNWRNIFCKQQPNSDF